LAAGARAADAPPEPAPWFPVGETLVYQVRWGVIPVAESVASTAWIEDEGARRLQLLVRTRSNSFLSRIYPVDDTIEPPLDPATLLPLRFTVRLNEGRHHTHEVTTFDHSAGEAVWRRIRPPPAPEKVRRFAIESNTVDLLTFMYQLRRTPMAPGTNYEHRVMVDEKIVPS